MVFTNLRDDIAAVMAHDPAARSRIEVLLCYPGVHARIFHRWGNALWRRRWRTLARFVSHVGRIATGIEIHPGATLGRRLFIDPRKQRGGCRAVCAYVQCPVRFDRHSPYPLKNET